MSQMEASGSTDRFSRADQSSSGGSEFRDKQPASRPAVPCPPRGEDIILSGANMSFYVLHTLPLGASSHWQMLMLL